MGVFGEQISREEEQLSATIISIICLYGDDGLPLDQLDDEFRELCGYSIPWKRFRADSLKSWITTLPYIYIVKDDVDRDILIEQSPKSQHIKNMIVEQKRDPIKNGVKRKQQPDFEVDNDDYPYKMKKRLEYRNLPEGTFIHTAMNNNYSSDSDRFEKFEQLESMLPLFYNHQALGDDFFVDIADTKLGYYVPVKGPKATGMCVVGQTISQLTARVQQTRDLAPRVVVMIGFQDLLNGHSISTMITDLRHLVIALKKKNTRITLVTLIPSPKLPSKQPFQTRMDIFNRAILDYASDPILRCSILDMSTIFLQESDKFKRDLNRFQKVAKNDPYKVFSDYGRKIFLSALKSCLRELIEYRT